LELKSFGKQKTIWQNLKQYAQNERGDKLSETFLLLNEILSISPSMSIPQVILLIIEKTGWNGLIENELDHYQKTANIDKLIDLARSFENTGFKNIYDFVEELKFITDNEIMESEAAVLTDENAVNIMSIHAAKGLQFPVVIIYNTNKKTGGKTRFTVSTQFGPGFPLKLNDKDVVIKNVDSAINLLNKLIKQQKETAEDKRVLYVAMTRAEDILALSVNAIEGKNNIYAPLGQMKLILEGLNIESMDELFDKDIKISLLTELEIRKNKKILTCNLEMNIGKIFEDEISLTENEESKRVILSAMILTDNITTNQTYMTFSPSKFLNFDYNKENFFDKYILGLPEELIDKKDIVNETNENTPGGVFGTAIHYALQYIDKWMKDDFSIYNDALKDTVTSSLESYQYNNINETTDEIIAECKSISETELIRKEYKNILNSKAEYFLEIPLDNNILHGIIDLLLKKEDGTFEIWDWKSNQINTEEDQIKTAWHYELQMRIYCYFISKLHPGQNKYNARLLFTRLAGKFKTSEDWTHKFVWTKEELDKTPEIINERIAKMKNEPLGIAD
jgi:ATP-dependent helicase/nuclease subunit A